MIKKLIVKPVKPVPKLGAPKLIKPVKPTPKVPDDLYEGDEAMQTIRMMREHPLEWADKILGKPLPRSPEIIDKVKEHLDQMHIDLGYLRFRAYVEELLLEAADRLQGMNPPEYSYRPNLKKKD